MPSSHRRWFWQWCCLHARDYIARKVFVCADCARNAISEIVCEFYVTRSSLVLRANFFMPSRPATIARRPRDPVRTKGRLLAAGIELFAAHGFHGVAVDAIVAAAGCNKRMLYHYFSDKEGLYAAVLQAVYARMEQVEMKPLPAAATTADVVREMMARHFEFLARDSEFVNLLMWENLNQGRVLARYPDLLTKTPVITRLREVLDAAKRRGEIGDVGDVRHLLILMMGMCFIYFANRHTLHQAIGLDLDQPRVQAEGLAMAQRMFLAYLGLAGTEDGPAGSRKAVNRTPPAGRSPRGPTARGHRQG